MLQIAVELVRVCGGSRDTDCLFWPSPATVLHWEGSVRRWLQETCGAQRAVSACWTLLGSCPLFRPRWSPGLCSLQFCPGLRTRNLFPETFQKPESQIKIPGGAHYGPPVTGQNTPKWATAKIFSSVLKQVTLAGQPRPSDASPGQGRGPGGGLSPGSSAAETRVLRHWGRRGLAPPFPCQPQRRAPHQQHPAHPGVARGGGYKGCPLFAAARALWEFPAGSLVLSLL